MSIHPGIYRKHFVEFLYYRTNRALGTGPVGGPVQATLRDNRRKHPIGGREDFGSVCELVGMPQPMSDATGASQRESSSLFLATCHVPCVEMKRSPNARGNSVFFTVNFLPGL